jgi:hypothetical protein
MNVLTKRQNFQLWQSGAFGNKLRAWRTIGEWRASGFSGLVALRSLQPGGGGPCRYNLAPVDVPHVVREWTTHGVAYDQIMVNEMASDGSILLQGEYLNDIYVIDGEPRWGYFLHSRARVAMRGALAIVPAIAWGLRADLMLREAMTPSSYDGWRELLDRYPGHVLEVSIYDRCLGDIPNRNALVWEIRRY